MARVSVDSTVVATFTTTNNAHFASNWARHLRDVGVRGLIVGLMSVRPRSAPFTTIAKQLREVGVEGVYACWSPEALVNPQGGRWFHLGQLLRTGQPQGGPHARYRQGNFAIVQGGKYAQAAESVGQAASTVG